MTIFHKLSRRSPILSLGGGIIERYILSCRQWHWIFSASQVCLYDLLENVIVLRMFVSYLNCCRTSILAGPTSPFFYTKSQVIVKGWTNPRGTRVRVQGVMVRVRIFIPLKNPYPWWMVRGFDKGQGFLQGLLKSNILSQKQFYMASK